MPFLFIDNSVVKVPSGELWDSYGLPNIASVQPVGNKNPAEVWFEQEVSRRQGKEDHFAKVQLQSNVLAVDVMSEPVISLRSDQTIGEAMSVITRNNVRHIPILTHDNALVGIVSERDLIKRIANQSNQSWADFYRTPIATVMMSTVLTVTDDTDVREVAYLMSCKGIGSLPVIRQEDHSNRPQLVGIITKSDLYLLVIDAVVIDERI